MIDNGLSTYTYQLPWWQNLGYPGTPPTLDLDKIVLMFSSKIKKKSWFPDFDPKKPQKYKNPKFLALKHNFPI
jgi:hypothetical protein